MSIITNAGADDRLTPGVRAAVSREDASQGVMQDAEGRAKAAAARRERPVAQILQLEAQQQVRVGEGENAELFDGVTLGYTLDEPAYDESILTLAPYVIRWEECPWWPPTFSGGGTRHPLKPVLGPDAWDAIIDGIYCMRCLNRHAAPHPAKCVACHLSAEHRERALDYIERAHKLKQTLGPNRAQRRSMRRRAAKGERRTPGGLVVPGWG